MMYVNRRTFIVKRGCTDEAVAMLVEGSGDSDARIYRSHYGPFDTVAFEIEAASMAEMEAIWNEWSESPESETFMQRWHEITKSGGKSEIWIRE